MAVKTKKNLSRGGGALLKKYGPNYFRELVERKHSKDREARKLWTKMNKKTK